MHATRAAVEEGIVPGGAQRFFAASRPSKSSSCTMTSGRSRHLFAALSKNPLAKSRSTPATKAPL